jgi:hypothetical protein
VPTSLASTRINVAADVGSKCPQCGRASLRDVV